MRDRMARADGLKQLKGGESLTDTPAHAIMMISSWVEPVIAVDGKH